MKKIHLLLIVLIIPSFIFSQQVENIEQITKNFTTGDFNNDGYIDDLASFSFDNNSSEIQIFNSTGLSFYKNENLSWKSKEFEIEKTNGKIVSGDFDNDGFRDDIASICEIGVDKTKIFVWLNNNGKFVKQSWWYGSDFNANQVFNTVVSGDFDNDGFIDDMAAFYDYQDETTKVFVWKSDKEKFNWPATMWYGGDFDASRIQGTMVSGDFDADGYQDDIAAFYNYIDNATKVFVWQSNKQKFEWPRTAYFNENYDIDKLQNYIVSGDFDRDGINDDIITYEMITDENAVAKLWTMNNFKMKQEKELGNFNIANNYILAGDFDKDNKIAEILDINSIELNVFKTDKEYMYYPENWLTLKSENLETYSKENNFFAQNNIKIYPTVTSEIITIDFTQLDDASIEIYDMLGKQVIRKEVTASSNSINVSELSKGNYILNIQQGNQHIKEKITVN